MAVRLSSSAWREQYGRRSVGSWEKSHQVRPFGLDVLSHPHYFVPLFDSSWHDFNFELLQNPYAIYS
jgi:hypothetical protein